MSQTVTFRAAAILLAIAGACLCISCGNKPSQPPAKLRVYCGAGLTAAMDEISAEFTRQTGIVLEIEYSGSGVLLSRIKLVKQGDIFLPAESDYIDMARQGGLVTEAREIACVWPVILVAKGNPRKIAAPADLARPGLRIGLGNPDACQIGRASLDVMKNNEIDLDTLSRNLVVRTTTVNELGLQVKTGHLDAALVWDATARMFAEDTDAVPIPAARNKASRYTVAILSFSAQPAGARRLVEFLQGPEARKTLHKHGFSLLPHENGAGSATATSSSPASREHP